MFSFFRVGVRAKLVSSLGWFSSGRSPADSSQMGLRAVYKSGHAWKQLLEGRHPVYTGPLILYRLVVSESLENDCLL